MAVVIELWDFFAPRNDGVASGVGGGGSFIPRSFETQSIGTLKTKDRSNCCGLYFKLIGYFTELPVLLLLPQ
jgi:hypothetical protein